MRFCGLNIQESQWLLIAQLDGGAIGKKLNKCQYNLEMFCHLYGAMISVLLPQLQSCLPFLLILKKAVFEVELAAIMDWGKPFVTAT